MRVLASLLLVAFFGAVHSQPAGVSEGWVRNLQEERVTIVAQLETRGVIFMPHMLGLPVPVSRENFERALLLAAFDPDKPFDVQAVTATTLRFDREYRQQLRNRIAVIDSALGSANVQAPVAPSPPRSLFTDGGPGSEPVDSRGLSFDEYLEGQTSDQARIERDFQIWSDGSTARYLRGQEICTFTVELIITGGTDRANIDPLRGALGQPVLFVPTHAKAEFHVQLYHPSLGTVRLSGHDALTALGRKGYFEKQEGGWQSTAAYDNFVNYGAGYQRGAQSCKTDSTTGGGGAPRVITKNGTVVQHKSGRVEVGVRWTIENPTGKAIRFTKMTRTRWVMQNDGMGRFVGGTSVTDTQSGFTLKPGRTTKDVHTWLPSSGRGNAGGTYREVYEGTDDQGKPVRLVLEFKGSEARWP